MQYVWILPLKLGQVQSHLSLEQLAVQQMRFANNVDQLLRTWPWILRDQSNFYIIIYLYQDNNTTLQLTISVCLNRLKFSITMKQSKRNNKLKWCKTYQPELNMGRKSRCRSSVIARDQPFWIFLWILTRNQALRQSPFVISQSGFHKQYKNELIADYYCWHCVI